MAQAAQSENLLLLSDSLRDIVLNRGNEQLSVPWHSSQLPIIVTKYLRKSAYIEDSVWAGDRALQLRALAAFADNQDSVPGTNTAAHNHL